MRYPFYIIMISMLWLTGCAHRYNPNDYTAATIQSVKQLSEADRTPSTGTAVGAGAGVSAGAVIGGVIGTGTAVAVSIASFGFAAPAIPGIIMGSMLVGGAIGGATGATTGYVYDYTQAGGLYEYQLRLETGETVVMRQQDVEPFTVNESVKLVWDKDRRRLIGFEKSAGLKDNAESMATPAS